MYASQMTCTESLKKLLYNPGQLCILSPVGDPSRPDCLLLPNAEGFRRLFDGKFIKRSPGRVRRMGVLNEFLKRSSLLKIRADIARGFDVSMVLFPLEMNLMAWGIVIDRIGRIFEVRCEKQGLLELVYQGGSCRTIGDWLRLVGTRELDEEDKIRRFFNKARRMVSDRIILAGTVGFGIWDALWMSFDLERALGFLQHDPLFAQRVFQFWKNFHLTCIGAMLDAGIKLIFFRENPQGFPSAENVAKELDPFIREHLLDLTKAVKSRGGYIFLDCDANEMIETDFPILWGFDGIGPMLFRDEEDLALARKSITEKLILVGSVAYPNLKPPIFSNSEVSDSIRSDSTRAMSAKIPNICLEVGLAS